MKQHKAPKPWGLIIAFIIGGLIIAWAVAALWFGAAVGIWEE